MKNPNNEFLKERDDFLCGIHVQNGNQEDLFI